MRLVLGLIAASLLAPDQPAAHDVQIGYDVKVLEMSGLGWRSTFYPELHPVARRGTATVWTSSRDVVARLAAKADKVQSAPKVTAFAGVRATVFNVKTRNLVADLGRRADGPVNHASFVALQPRVETAAEGYRVALAGRALEQGVLAQVAIEEQQITAVHTVKLTEATEGKSGRDVKDDDRVDAQIQVPEIAGCRVAGEWLIPHDGVLVVSLGVHTVADAEGKAVVREHVALVEAGRVQEKAGGVRPASAQPAAVPAPVPAFAAAETKVPMPAPVVPSRSLPQARNASGEPVHLPPLPDEFQPPPTARPGSSEPCATPQTKGAPVGDPIPSEPVKEPLDPESRRAGFEREEECCALQRDCPAARTAAAPAAPKSFTFRIPLKGGVVIEVHASARSLPFAGVPAPPEVKPAR